MGSNDLEQMLAGDDGTVLSRLLRNAGAAGMGSILAAAVKADQSVEETRLAEAAATNPNALTEDGVPVLTVAIRERRFELVSTLLAAGADPDPKSGVDRDDLPLLAAVRLEPQGRSPIKGGPGWLAKSLEDLDSDEEAEDTEVDRLRNSAIVMDLLDAGAKPRHAAILGNAVRCHTVEVIERLLKAGAKHRTGEIMEDPLYCAVTRRDLAMLDLLEKAGVPIENRSTEGSLYWDAMRGWGMNLGGWEEVRAVWEWLHERGIDVDHENDGFTSLHGCVRNTSLPGLRWLLERGADPSVRFGHQGTPLDLLLHEQDILLSRGGGAKPEKERAEEFAVNAEMIALLQGSGAIGSTAEELQNDAEEDPQVGVPVGNRRGIGLHESDYYKCHQILVRAEPDALAELMEQNADVDRVERDALGRLSEISCEANRVAAIVKLKQHPWLQTSGLREAPGDQLAARFSDKLGTLALEAGQQSTAGVVYHRIFENGRLLEAFESDGGAFVVPEDREPEHHDADGDPVYSEGDAGTSFTSERWDPSSVSFPDWSSPYAFVAATMEELDAYLGFIGLGHRDAKSKELEVWGRPDETTADAIERLDLVIYRW